MAINIRTRLQAIEKLLRAELEKIRSSFSHPGDKGVAFEKVFRTFLREHLSRNLEVGEGEVIDTSGQSAGGLIKPSQIDVVVASEYHPRTFPLEGPGTFFVEGVLAAGEVKTHLTTKDIATTVTRRLKFKNLSPFSGGWVFVSGKPKFFERRPYFLFAVESDMTLEHIKQTLAEDTTHSDALDAVFVLDRGSLINLHSGNDPYQLRDGDGKTLKGWASPPTNEPLLDLIGWLLASLPNALRSESILLRYIVASL